MILILLFIVILHFYFTKIKYLRLRLSFSLVVDSYLIGKVTQSQIRVQVPGIGGGWEALVSFPYYKYGEKSSTHVHVSRI